MRLGAPHAPLAALPEIAQMTLIPDYNNPYLLLTPKKTLEYLDWRYGIHIALASFYSMINRKEGPTPTYFRGLPRFTVPNIDEWVRNNLSPDRK
jgi:hypothetical protein